MNGPLRHEDPAGLAVVIVTFNNADTVARSIQNALALPECERVVVVDNGSDCSDRIAEDAGATVLRRPDNPGFGTSHNAGVALVTQPFVLLLNPDADPVPLGIEAGIEVLRSQPTVGGVQGIIDSRHHGGPERSMGPDLRWIHLMGRALGLRSLLRTSLGQRLAKLGGVGDHVDRVPEVPVDVETLAAVSPLIRKEAFESVGGFDEGYFLYGEDLDLCRRLRLHGWRLVGLPIPWASHADGSTSESGFDREVAWWTGTIRYAATWWTGTQFASGMLASALMTCRLVAQRPQSCMSIIRSLLWRPLRCRNTWRVDPADR